MPTSFPAPLTPVRPKPLHGLDDAPPSPPSNAKITMSWWEKSMIKRSSYAIENLLDNVIHNTPFLLEQQQQQADSELACLDRSEVVVGTLLGYGSFSNVYEVTAIQLAIGDDDGDDDDRDQPTSTGCFTGRAAIQQRKRRRKHLADTAVASPSNTSTCTTSTTRYALKQLKSELVQNNDAFQAAACDLLVEAQYLASLDHPNILKLRGMARRGAKAYADSGSYDGFFLITDRLHETLQQRIQTWKEQRQLALPSMAGNDDLAVVSLLEEKLDISLQIARALEYLHQRRLIFRDLKPTNIGFQADNTVQLYDLGFCRQLPTPAANNSGNSQQQQQQQQRPGWCTTSTGTWSSLAGGDHQEDVTNDNAMYNMSGKGSLMYLANEVLATGRYNQKCDVYSLAMIMYEMMALEKPFPQVRTAEQHRALICDLGERPVFLQHHHVPPRVQHIIEQSWKGQVSQRWSSHKVVQELEALLLDMERGTTATLVFDHAAAEPCWMPASSSSSSTNVLCTSFVDWLGELAADVCMGYKILGLGRGIPKEHLKKQDSAVSADNPNPMVVSFESSSVSRHGSHELKHKTTGSTMEESVISSRDESSTMLNPMVEPQEDDSAPAGRAQAMSLQEDQGRLFSPTASGMERLETRCPPSPLKPEEEFIIAWNEFNSEMDTTVPNNDGTHKNKTQHKAEDEPLWLVPPIATSAVQDY